MVEPKFYLYIFTHLLILNRGSCITASHCIKKPS